MPLPFVPIAIGLGVTTLFSGGLAINYLSKDRDAANSKSETYAHQAADLQRQVFENEVLLNESLCERDNISCELNATRRRLSLLTDLVMFRDNLLSYWGTIAKLAILDAELDEMKMQYAEFFKDAKTAESRDINAKIEQKITDVQAIMTETYTRINTVLDLIDKSLQINKTCAQSNEINKLFELICRRVNDFYLRLIEVRKLSVEIRHLIKQNIDCHVKFNKAAFTDFDAHIDEFQRINSKEIGIPIKIVQPPVADVAPPPSTSDPNSEYAKKMLKMLKKI